MDNLEDTTKRNANSAGESRQLRPDPIVQARDDSSRPHEGMQPTEIIPSAAGATLTPNQFMGTGVPTQAASSVTELLVSLLRFKWTILLVFVLVAAPMIVAFWTQITPLYTAKGEVRIRPIIPRLVFRTDDNGAIPFYSSFVNTHISIIKSPIILQRILDEQNVQETQWYKNPPKSIRQRLLGRTYSTMMRLRDSLSVRSRRGTEIVDVSFIADNAKDAQIFVDTVLEQYIKYAKETSNATEDKLFSQLVDQYKSLENEILGREKICADLSRLLGTEIPQELVFSKRLRLDYTQDRLSEQQKNITQFEWEMKQGRTGDSNDVSVASIGRMEKQPKYLEDAEWRKLDIDVRIMRHKIANSSLTTKHPNLVRMTKDVEFSEGLIRLREAQLDEQWRDRLKNAAGVPMTITNASSFGYEEQLISLKQRLARAKHEEQLLLAEFEKQQAEFERLFDGAQLLDKENKTLRHKRDLFGAVQQHLDQKTMERNVPGSIEVLNWASAQSEPSSDRRVTFTAMALFMGLGMGSGVAFLRARRDQAIYTHNDMPYPMQVPFLGYLPVIRTRRSLDYEVSPAQIESIRFLRTALLSRLDGYSNTTVLVTSACAGTGKSNFTMMLGKSLAQAGKKVLIIDVDLQKMTLTKQFNLSDKCGFIESLCYRSVDKGHIFPTEISGLSIVPAGKRGDDGAAFEEIANGAFKTYISKLRQQYDIILLDSAPILMMADTTIMSSQVDGTIVVEREFVSRRADIIKSLARLGSARGRLLGTVFVGSTKNQVKYGYPNYRRTN